MSIARIQSATGISAWFTHQFLDQAEHFRARFDADLSEACPTEYGLFATFHKVDAEGLRELLKKDRLVGRGQGSLFSDRGSLYFRVDGLRLRLGFAEGAARYEEIRDLLQGLQELRKQGVLSRAEWEAHLRHLEAQQAVASLGDFQAVAEFVVAQKLDEGASEATIRSRYLPGLIELSVALGWSQTNRSA